MFVNASMLLLGWRISALRRTHRTPSIEEKFEHELKKIGTTMKKVKVVADLYYNQLETDLNRLVGKEGWEIKACYSDGKMHYAVLEKEE